MPIVMGVTIESGVSIVNQYPDTVAGAPCSNTPIHTLYYVETYPPSLSDAEIQGSRRRDSKKGGGGGELDE